MRTTAMTTVLAAAAMFCSDAPGQQNPEITREAVGERAARLVAMELQPFDVSRWSLLSDWTNGDAPDSAAMSGKVVVIATWASWNPAAVRVLPMLQRLHEAHAQDGLIVVGVHHATGWDRGVEMLGERGLEFLAAHDPKGAFREALLIDQDPDFYLVDRAGQLRFADIRTEAVQKAVELLLGEGESEAAEIRERLAAEAARRDQELRRPKALHEGIDLLTLPDLPFAAPPESAYARASWPAPREENNNTRGRFDQGPQTRAAPESGWLHGVKPNTDGRVVVYYSWLLDDMRSAEVARSMDRLQQRYGRDLVVVGVCVGLRTDDRNSRNQQTIDGEALARRIERFVVSQGLSHPMLANPSAVSFGGNNRGGQSEALAAMVVSSDSTVRWEGGASDPAFRAALDRVVDVDPGVRARRAVEQAYIRSRKK